jgi:hypothetical protein
MAGGQEGDADGFEKLISDYEDEITRITELVLLEIQEKFIETIVKYKSRKWTIKTDDVAEFLSVEFVPTLDALTMLLESISTRLNASQRLGYQILDFMDKYIVESIVCGAMYPFTRDGARQLEFDVFAGLVRVVKGICKDAGDMFKRFGCIGGLW